jgi:hypothetical protein
MTETSRRALLRASAVGLVAAPFATVATAVAAPTTTLYTRARFMRQRKRGFNLVTRTGRWRMTLTQVEDLHGAARLDAHRFALTFRCSTAGPAQGTYTFRRPGFTPTTLFVVPSDASRRTYQAIINRLG